MDWTLELVVVPVSDVDRAKAFYVDQLGFALDVDMSTGPDFRVVQLTPQGSACSIAIGIGLSEGRSRAPSTACSCASTTSKPPIASSSSTASTSASRSISVKRAGLPASPRSGAAMRRS